MITTVIKDYFQNFRIVKLIIYVMIFFAYSFAYQQTSIPSVFHLDWAMMACVWLIVHFVFGDLFRSTSLPEIFYLVPKQNGALKGYIKTRLFIEVGFFFALTLLSMLIKYGMLSAKESITFYIGNLYYQFITCFLFLLFLILFRASAVIHTFQKSTTSSLSTVKMILHYLLSILTFATILWADANVRTGMEITKDIVTQKKYLYYPTAVQLSSAANDYPIQMILGCILIISILHTIWYVKLAFKQLEQA